MVAVVVVGTYIRIIRNSIFRYFTSIIGMFSPNIECFATLST